ncbi:MAG: ORF6N domain-containing protein [Vicinamibacterales bacterium]
MSREEQMVSAIARVQTAMESQVRVIRGRRVMLDLALAALYGVTTRALNQAVKRNRSRFPVEFAFQLSSEEFESLRSQTVISNAGRGGRRSRPWVFTEHGAIMAASVLNSRRAIDMSIYVVRAFIRLREAAAGHAELLAKLQVMERKLGRHDVELKEVFDVLRRILAPPRAPRRRIGFRLPTKT